MRKLHSEYFLIKYLKIVCVTYDIKCVKKKFVILFTLNEMRAASLNMDVYLFIYFFFCFWHYIYTALLFYLKFVQRQIEWTLMDSMHWKIYILKISRAVCFCTMIDWVSIVRHSRRRFSDYMFAVPAKIRKRRRAKRHANSKLDSLNDRGANTISCNASGRNVCGCCWRHVSSNKYRDLGLQRWRKTLYWNLIDVKKIHYCNSSNFAKANY